MKKKHLNALNSLEKWLSDQKVLTSDLSQALSLVKSAVQDVIEETSNKELTLPPPKEIAHQPSCFALYSDGGCRGNPGPGAYAYLIQNHQGDILGEGVEFESLTTNNKMELMGVIRGLQELKEVLIQSGGDPLKSEVKVVTDSQYVVNGMKSWVTGWKARGWKKADKKTPENLDLWQSLDLIKDSFMKVEWEWVKGHGGHPQNEYCDQKANEAMDAHLL